MALNPQEGLFIRSLRTVVNDLRRGLPQVNVYDPQTGRFLRVPKNIALSIIQRTLRNPSFVRQVSAVGQDRLRNLRILANQSPEKFEKGLTEASTAIEIGKIELETTEEAETAKAASAKKPERPEKLPKEELIKKTEESQIASSTAPVSTKSTPILAPIAQASSQVTKNLVSSTAIKIRQTIANHPTAIQSVGLGLVGAAIGGVLTQNPASALLGAGIGAAAPAIFKQMREASDPRRQVKTSLFKTVTNKIATTIAQNKTASLLAQSLITGTAGAGLGLLTPFGPGLGFSAGASIPFILRGGIGSLLIKGVSSAVNTAGDVFEGNEDPSSASQQISSPAGPQGGGSGSGSNQNPAGNSGSRGRRGSRRPSGASFGLLRGGFSNPWVWVIAIILVMFLSFALGFFGGDQTAEAPGALDGASISLVKSGPEAIADNSVEITYKITVTFKGKGLASFKVIDPLPAETTFVSAKSNPSGNIPCQSSYEGKIDPALKQSTGETVVWNLTGLTANSSADLCVTIKSNQNDVWLVNKVTSELGPGSIIGGGSNNLEVVIASGPVHVDSVNDQISYQIVATYTGTGTAKVRITNPIPENAEFVSGDQQGNCESQASPSQTEPFPVWGPFELTQGQSAKACLTIKATADKVRLAEIAKAQIIDLKLPASNPTGGDFDGLMIGQGRSTGVLGDEASFVATAMKNGGAKVLGKETQVRQIYQAATAKQVNPLAVLSIWGVEQGWRIVPSSFGCSAAEYPTFDSQLNCSVNTLNSWMTKFEKSGQQSLIIEKESCTYFDAFAYAYEWYTPVCHVYDKNEHSRKNFVDYYRGFLGN